ncbi:MAG TPA: Mur ligase family protein [Marmoricola sp.]|nr:Mur ligase family protein [Marmoricola sp.]
MTALVELRVLEGPNLYFPRAAIKLTLDLTGITRTSGSALEQRLLLRQVAQIVRGVARAAGTTRLGLRVRPTTAPNQVVVAYPWRDRNRARALGEAVVEVLDRLAEADPPRLDELVGAAGSRVAAEPPGSRPTTLKPRVPVVAVTGTNGKTTTSRMIAHLARTAGHVVGWSNTDGIYVDGELIEAGDYSGPSGAGRVLADERVDFAVTETARGGILLKGIGITRNDVSVVTNVSADHLGLHGIDTLDQLAEVKSVVPQITKSSGWAVLNGDDPRVFAMRLVTKAQPWVFSRDPGSPAIRDVLTHGGRATTVIDGQVVVLRPDEEADALVAVVDVPMTLAGLSHFNVENVLAAASAGLAAGLPRAAVVAGLTTFLPDTEHNPGRMNMFTLDGVTVVMDLAHNEAGLEALIEVLRGVRAPGCRVLLGLGAVGDRQDELLELLGEIAARDADGLVIGHKERYLRGRSTDELDALLRAGAARVGVTDVPSYPTELASLQALVASATPGDAVGLMCHAERDEVRAWLLDEGATPDSPAVLRQKVVRAHG